MKTSNIKESLIVIWNKIKLRNRPSYLFFTISILLGLIFASIPGGFLGLAVAWTFERLNPPKPVISKGVIRNRTKGIINIYAIFILSRMLKFYLIGQQLDQLNSVGRIAGVATEWALGSSSGYNFSIVSYSVFISVWLFVQASFAKRANVSSWRWIFLGFAVASFPYMHTLFGPLWFLANLASIFVLLVSSLMFRLPQEWPTAMPPLLPPQPAVQALSIEAELVVLKRMLDSDLLSQDEFSLQKQEILQRHRG